jgi:hypothetical protein
MAATGKLGEDYFYITEIKVNEGTIKKSRLWNLTTQRNLRPLSSIQWNVIQAARTCEHVKGMKSACSCEKVRNDFSTFVSEVPTGSLRPSSSTSSNMVEPVPL